MLHSFCAIAILSRVMNKNVTLRLDSGLLQQLRHLAVDDDMSLSAWIAMQLKRCKCIGNNNVNKYPKKEILKALEIKCDSGGNKFSREELHER